MKLHRILLLAALPLFLLVGCQEDTSAPGSKLDEAWDADNDPRHLGSEYDVNFSSLPSSAVLNKTPWTDYYWANNKGGLSFRWATGTSQSGHYNQLIDGRALSQMTPNQIALLSPAEKFDIMRGDLTYSFTQYERGRTNPNEPTWFGLCHGVAPASINFEEPGPVTLQSPLGISVPFGAADIKGLLAFAQQHDRRAEDSRILGRRCNISTRGNWGTHPLYYPECRDVNAGSFHIVLANFIGKRQQSFVMDTESGEEVWNYPVSGFNSQVLGQRGLYRGAAPGTAQILDVRTIAYYTAGTGPRWEPGLVRGQTGSESYTYTLELDRNGNIIGGEWLQEKRPDFLWTQSTPRFEGVTAVIGDIYRASIGR